MEDKQKEGRNELKTNSFMAAFMGREAGAINHSTFIEMIRGALAPFYVNTKTQLEDLYAKREKNSVRSLAIGNDYSSEDNVYGFEWEKLSQFGLAELDFYTQVGSKQMMRAIGKISTLQHLGCSSLGGEFGSLNLGKLSRETLLSLPQLQSLRLEGKLPSEQDAKDLGEALAKMSNLKKVDLELMQVESDKIIDRLFEGIAKNKSINELTWQLDKHFETHLLLIMLDKLPKTNIRQLTLVGSFQNQKKQLDQVCQKAVFLDTLQQLNIKSEDKIPEDVNLKREMPKGIEINLMEESSELALKTIYSKKVGQTYLRSVQSAEKDRALHP